MANTPNIDLVKPAGTDHALVSVLNANSDKIDTFAGTTNQAIANIHDLIKVENFYFDNTGSVAAGATVALQKAYTVPTGYKFLSISPQYSGDDQFCWVSISNTVDGKATATIRNVSNAADSGTPTAKIYYIRDI